MRKLIVALLAVVAISFMTTTASAVKYSWEGTTEGWAVDPDSWNSFAIPKTLADGIPPEAITDGTYALEVGRPGRIPPATLFPKWASLIRGESDLLKDDIRANTTISFDAFIPYASYDFEGDNFWGEFQFNIEGDGMQSANRPQVAFDFKQIQQGGTGTAHDLGESFSFSWDYASDPGYVSTSDPGYDPETDWLQLTVAIVGGGNLTPVYIDNFQITGAPGVDGDFDGDTDVDGADFLEWQRDSSNLSLTDWQNGYGTGSGTATLGAVPEPSTLILLAAASCAGLFSRRRVR